jgi:hypothetical protein
MRRLSLLALAAGGAALLGCAATALPATNAEAKPALALPGTNSGAIAVQARGAVPGSKIGAASCFLAWRDGSGDFASGTIAPDGTVTLLAVYAQGARVVPTPTLAELAQQAR